MRGYLAEQDPETGDDRPDDVSTGNITPPDDAEQECPEDHRPIKPLKAETTEPAAYFQEIFAVDAEDDPPSQEEISQIEASQALIEFREHEVDAIKNARDALSDIYMGILAVRSNPVTAAELASCLSLLVDVRETMIFRIQDSPPDDAA